MASNDQIHQRLFQWTVCAYKKEGMDDEEYHKYIGEKHGPLTAPFLAKYGIIKYTLVSQPHARYLTTRDNFTCFLS